MVYTGWEERREGGREREEEGGREGEGGGGRRGEGGGGEGRGGEGMREGGREVKEGVYYTAFLILSYHHSWLAGGCYEASLNLIGPEPIT